MTHDNTWMLTPSSPTWIVDWENATVGEKWSRGHAYNEVIVDVTRDANFLALRSEKINWPPLLA